MKIQNGKTQRPIRVCYMIDRLIRGGTELRLVRLLQALDRRVVEPFLVLLDGMDDLSRSLEPTGVPILRLGIRRLRNPSTLVKLLQLRKFLRKQSIDTLELYFADSTTLGVPAAKLAGVRRIFGTCFNLQHSFTLFDRLRDRLYRPFLTATITNCQAGREAVTRSLPAKYHHRVVILENGIDLDQYLEIPPPTLNELPRRMHVGMLANLRPVKDPETFIRAAAILVNQRSDVDVFLAGDGPLRASMEKLCRDLGIENHCHFLGNLLDVPSFLASLDVAVLCSRAEGLSNAVIEYMAASRPIVVTAVGGNLELIDQEQTGIIVPPNDPSALAQGIERILKSRDLAVRLGTAARRKAEQRYSVSKMVGRFQNFYTD